jgi:hypothetical protein
MADITQSVPQWADPAVPDGALDPQGVSRRAMLRRAGLFGAGFAVAATAGGGGALSTPGPAAADDREPNDDHRDLMYLVGDHHVHSVYSHDAKYRLPDLARRAAQFGLDWMVFTEHSNVGHADAGGALQEHDQVLAARAENPRLPCLAHLDVIRGVQARPGNRDGFTAPATRVEHTVDTHRRTGTYTLRIPLGAARESGYVRLRGSDGRRHGPGPRGRAVDPHGPLPHLPGDGDPWRDTWLYTNPIFIDVR